MAEVYNRQTAAVTNFGGVDMKKAAIIGGGYIGLVHANAYKNSSKADLVAVVDVNEEAGKKLAKEYKCTFYTDAQEMMDKEKPDFVDICVPTFLHEQFVLLAAKNKVNVLCEKPIALSVEAVDRMMAAVEESGIRFMVAQVIRFWPEYVKIREMYEKGDFGKVKMVYANRLAQFPAWMNWNQDPKQSGGGLFDLHLHDIDMCRSLFGEVKSVYAVGYKNEFGCWNHVGSSLSFKNGLRCLVEGAYEMTDEYPFTMTFRIVGQEVTADYLLSAGMNVDDPTSFKRTLTRYETGKQLEKIKIDDYDAYQAEIDYYSDCLESGEEFSLVSTQEVRDVIKILLALEESLESGKAVKL